MKNKDTETTGITLTLREATDSFDGLAYLSNLNDVFDGAETWSIGRLHRAMVAEIETFQNVRNALLKRHGKLKKGSNPETYEWPTPVSKKRFDTEIEKLMLKGFTLVGQDKLSFKIVNETGISPRFLAAMEPLLKDLPE